jgi:hypothetical protein
MKNVYERSQLSSYGCREVYRREIAGKMGLRAQFDASPFDFDRVREKVIPRQLEAAERAKLQWQAIEFEQFAITVQGFTDAPMTGFASGVKRRQDERYDPGTLYIPTSLAARYGIFANFLHKYAAVAEQVALDSSPRSELEKVATHLCAIVRPYAWNRDADINSWEYSY